MRTPSRTAFLGVALALAALLFASAARAGSPVSLPATASVVPLTPIWRDLGAFLGGSWVRPKADCPARRSVQADLAPRGPQTVTVFSTFWVGLEPFGDTKISKCDSHLQIASPDGEVIYSDSGSFQIDGGSFFALVRVLPRRQQLLRMDWSMGASGGSIEFKILDFSAGRPVEMLALSGGDDPGVFKWTVLPDYRLQIAAAEYPAHFADYADARADETKMTIEIAFDPSTHVPSVIPTGPDAAAQVRFFQGLEAEIQPAAAPAPSAAMGRAANPVTPETTCVEAQTAVDPAFIVNIMVMNIAGENDGSVSMNADWLDRFVGDDPSGNEGVQSAIGLNRATASIGFGNDTTAADIAGPFDRAEGPAHMLLPMVQAECAANPTLPLLTVVQAVLRGAGYD